MEYVILHNSTSKNRMWTIFKVQLIAKRSQIAIRLWKKFPSIILSLKKCKLQAL